MTGNKEPHLRLVFSADRTYLPGLAVSMASALAFLPEKITPRITIIHEGFRDTDSSAISSIARRIHPLSECTFLAIDQISRSLPAAPGLHPLTYARLLAPDLVSEDFLVYLDSDLLVLRDVSELPGLLGKSDLAAAPRCGRLGDDCPWLDPERMNADDPYFCAGVLAVRRGAWQSAGITEEALNLARWEPENCRNYDQTVLNYILHRRVTVLDETWNWNHWQFAAAPTDQALIIHYITGGKPWRAPSATGVAGLWKDAFELLCRKDLPWIGVSMQLRSRVEDLAFQVGTHLPSEMLNRLGTSWAWRIRRWKDESTDCSRARLRTCMGRLKESAKL